MNLYLEEKQDLTFARFSFDFKSYLRLKMFNKNIFFVLFPFNEMCILGCLLSFCSLIRINFNIRNSDFVVNVDFPFFIHECIFKCKQVTIKFVKETIATWKWQYMFLKFLILYLIIIISLEGQRNTLIIRYIFRLLTFKQAD